MIAVERRPAVPGAALRRRRRPRVRRQRLQHGDRDAVRRLRRLPAARPAVAAHRAAPGRRPPASPATSASTSAALCAAIEFGIQPTLFHTAAGTPLYSPFHLAQTIPAMALAHLTVAGAVERAHRRRDRLPAARRPAAAAPQPPPASPTTDADSRRRARSRWRWARRRRSASMVAAHAARAARARRRVRRGRAGGPRPRQVRAERRAAAACDSTTGSGATRCSTATASRTATRRLAYIVSAVVGALAVGLAIVARDRSLVRLVRRATQRRRRRHAADEPRHDAHAGRRRPQWLLAGRGRALPVRLHRQAQEGALRRKTHHGGADLLCGRRCSPRTSPRTRGLLQRIDPRVKVLGAGRAAGRRPRSSTTSPCWSAIYAVTLVLARRLGAAAGLLRQAGVAVRPDLHRHRRAARRRSTSSPRATSSCRSAPGSATRRADRPGADSAAASS